jgi:hypothetical protein
VGIHFCLAPGFTGVSVLFVFNLPDLSGGSVFVISGSKSPCCLSVVRLHFELSSIP